MAIAGRPVGPTRALSWVPFGTLLACGTRNGIHKGQPFQGRGIPVVKMGEVYSARRVRKARRDLLDLSASERGKLSLLEDDLLFCRTSLVPDGVGHCAIVVEDLGDCTFASNLIRARIDSSKAYPLFYFYYFSSPQGTQQLRSIARGTSVTTITGPDISALRVPLPPLPEQKRIAGILGALDDKIELNRRMNETLEAMARAIFKSWFVDFDPVHAKARGEKPFGMDAETAALFPDKFTDSPLGPIPEGWETLTVGHIASVIDCLHSRKPERLAQGKPLLQLNNIRDDGMIDMSDVFNISEEDYTLWTSRMEASPSDCVVTNVGRVGAVAQIPAGLKAALGRNMTGLRCKPSYQIPTFLLEYLLSDLGRAEIDSNKDSGTILDALNVKNIPRLRIPFPGMPTAQRFEVAVRPLRALMEANAAESRTLAHIRDTLLPWLIGGRH